MNEGYDPSTSGDAGYGVALYIDGTVECVMDIKLQSTSTALQQMWCRNSIYGGEVIRTNTYGSLSGVKNAPYGTKIVYEFLTHDACDGFFEYWNNGGGAGSGVYKEYTLTVSVPAVVPTSPPVSFTPVDGDSSPVSSPTPKPTTDSSSSTETGPYIIIGQNWHSEFASYIDTFGVPNGASFYFPLEPGKDMTWWAGSGPNGVGNGYAFLEHINANYGGMLAQVALSIKHTGGCGFEGTCNKCYLIWQSVLNGQYNENLDQLVTDVFNKYTEVQYLLRIEYEVQMYNHAWKSTNGCGSWNQIVDDRLDASVYKNAFNYIANYIRNTKKVKNVWFVYHPMRYTIDVQNLYPGDEFVDIVGWSFFNNDVCMAVTGNDGQPITACEGDYPYSESEIEPQMAESIQWIQSKGKLQMISESTPQHPIAGIVDNHKVFIERVYNAAVKYNMFAWAYINQDWCSHAWSCPPWSNSRMQEAGKESVAAYWENEILPNTQNAAYHVNLPSIADAFTDSGELSSKHTTAMIIAIVMFVLVCCCGIALFRYLRNNKKNKGVHGFESDGDTPTVDQNNNNDEEQELEIEVEVSMETYPQTTTTND